MEIRDAVHGAIKIEKHEKAVIDSRFFQRLRGIKQLGFAEFAFPGACHNRYSHSLGAMATASEVFDHVFSSVPDSEAKNSLRITVRLAALLHDLGHGPLSHTSEIGMPRVRELDLPFSIDKPRKATHEDYTLKMILDSELTEILNHALGARGISARHIAALISPNIHADSDFFCLWLDGVKTDFQPLLRQIVSSELDADRMDYLRRDSFYAGVSYGNFDADWLLSNFTYRIVEGSAFLTLNHRALYAFENFLLSRFHMFLMVYFHFKSAIYDEMLFQYFCSSDCDYRLPANLEEYCKTNDAQLLAHLNQSKNSWAQRIARQKPFRLFLEIHSGLPASKKASHRQAEFFLETREILRKNQIPFLEKTSKGQLSKYFGEKNDPIYACVDNSLREPEYFRLDEYSDLFEKFREERTISRIYVSPEEYERARKLLTQIRNQTSPQADAPPYSNSELSL